MAADAPGTLAAIREMGLEYVELAGTYGMPAPEFGDLLKANDLKVSGCHVGIDALEDGFDQLVADGKALGTQWVILPWIAEDRRNWSELAKSLTGFGEQLSGEGLSFAYHNHDFELGPDQGLRTLIAESHPQLVHFQIDLGWVRFAGEDPAKFLWELGPRAPLVHLKDMDPARDNPHVVAGDGAVHWDEVLAACSGIGVQFGAIEMDHPPNNPLEDVRACAKYFQDRGVA